jgi:RNA polymerase-binding transcription factor DksA
MTPASKGSPSKRAPGSRQAAAKKSATGNKSSALPVAADKRSAQKKATTAKKAASVKKAVSVKKAATTSKRTASPPKKAPVPSAKRGASTAKKAAPHTKTAPTGKKAAAAPKKATSSKSAGSAPASKKATGPATKKAGSVPVRPKSTLGPKPKPPPVRPKTGPYAKDAKFLEEVRELLLAERAIYQEQATSLRAEADSLALEREPGDVQFDEESGEGGTVTVDRERNLALSGQATLAVEEIDDAMARIADKTYGYCERCFQPIPKPRLRALPYARLCVACKSGGLSRR